jgi:hypothetical protein
VSLIDLKSLRSISSRVQRLPEAIESLATCSSAARLSSPVRSSWRAWWRTRAIISSRSVTSSTRRAMLLPGSGNISTSTVRGVPAASATSHGPRRTRSPVAINWTASVRSTCSASEGNASVKHVPARSRMAPQPIVSTTSSTRPAGPSPGRSTTIVRAGMRSTIWRWRCRSSSFARESVMSSVTPRMTAPLMPLPRVAWSRSHTIPPSGRTYRYSSSTGSLPSLSRSVS